MFGSNVAGGAYRDVGTMTFGTFYDLVVRLSTDSGTNLDA
jgi:hypothetical protein